MALFRNMPSFVTNRGDHPESFGLWLGKRLVVRRYARRLRILDFLVSRNLWLHADSIREASAEEIENLATPLLRLNHYVFDQLAILDRYLSLPIQQGNHAWDFRIARIVREYLYDLSSPFDIERFRSHLQQIQTKIPLTFPEINCALPVLGLCLLLKIHDLFLSRSTAVGDSCVRTVHNALVALDSSASCDTYDFVRSLTSYEGLLREDPAGIYDGLDGETKHMYRAAVDKLASECSSTAEQVARSALDFCFDSMTTSANNDPIRKHIGYYLLDDGIAAMRRRLTQAEGATDHKRAHHPLLIYGLGIVVSTVLLVPFFFLAIRPLLLSPVLAVLCIGAALVLCSETANRILDDVLGIACKKRVLPRIDFTSGIPLACKTILAVPTLLTNGSHIRYVFKLIEKHFLSVNSKAIHCAVLTDYVDSDTKLPSGEERALLELASELTRQLNRKHGSDDRTPFCLLHRDRSFSRVQRRWIGWERKRGKLRQLNTLVLTGRSEFDHSQGNVQALRGAPYVVVLDDNTEFTPFGIQTLIGTISHPLNRPKVNTRLRTLERGYAILQPFPCVWRESARGWGFASVLLTNALERKEGTLNVRLLHFDLFGECSFFGKGLYDVNSFEVLISGRIPPERTLSHDVLESGYLKTGFAESVAFGESCPSTLELYYERLHRWTRGDWQNFSSILGRHVSGISGYTKYVIFNFIRRSLSPIARTFLLVLIIVSAGKLAWSRFIGYLVITGLPEYSGILVSALYLYGAAQFLFTFPSLWRSFIVGTKRNVLTLVTSMHLGMVMLDAIVRTVLRLVLVTRLLEWRSASALEMQPRRLGLLDFYGFASLGASVLLALFAFRSRLWSIPGAIIVIAWCFNVLLYFRTGSRPPYPTKGNAIGTEHASASSTLA